MNGIIVIGPISVFAVAMALVVPRYDRIWAWSYAAVLVLMAGFRVDGFDYDEYLVIIETVRHLQGEDVFTRLFFAKDPIFLLVIEAVSIFTDSTAAIFICIAMPSVFLKVASTASFPRHRTLCITLYGLLLAPGLEFAAIRAGLGLGFLLFGLHAVHRFGWLPKVLAIMSHSSMLLPIFLQAVLRRPILFPVLVVFGVFALFALAPLVVGDPRYINYFDNSGTFNALLLPLLSLISALLLVRSMVKGSVEYPVEFHSSLLVVLCSMLSLLLALPAVTISYRFLEIGWTLMLFALCAPSRPRSSGQRLALSSAWALWMIILITTNVLRRTWQDMATI